jgi:hypothetical protein
MTWLSKNRSMQIHDQACPELGQVQDKALEEEDQVQELEELIMELGE